MKHTKAELLKNHYDSKKFDCYDKLEIELVDLLLKEHKQLLLEKTAYKKSGLSPERVQELAKAEAEGRLVVLPCKVGDIVYRKARFCDRIVEATVSKLTIDKLGILGVASRGENTSFHFDSEDIGERVFFTREAAEKALGGAEK